MEAPSRAKAKAVARPIPREAPVMRATLPASLPFDMVPLPFVVVGLGVVAGAALNVEVELDVEVDFADSETPLALQSRCEDDGCKILEARSFTCDTVELMCGFCMLGLMWKVTDGESEE